MRSLSSFAAVATAETRSFLSKYSVWWGEAWNSTRFFSPVGVDAVEERGEGEGVEEDAGGGRMVTESLSEEVVETFDLVDAVSN
jgi:hypothetical protein